MEEAIARQLIELIKSQSRVEIGQGAISGNTLTINGVSGEIVGECEGDNVLLKGDDGEWYGFVSSNKKERQTLSTRNIRNHKRQAPVDKTPDLCVFLIDVSNSIEMDAVTRVRSILDNTLEGQFAQIRNQAIILLPFSDTVYTPNTFLGTVTTPRKAITLLDTITTAYNALSDKSDRFDPNTFTYSDFGIAEGDPLKDEKLQAYSTFWVDEGTDLPENGIDALYTALTNIDNKYKTAKKTFYLVTDNNEFSRNINEATDVYDLFLNTSKSKLYFDIFSLPPVIKWDGGTHLLNNSNYLASYSIPSGNINVKFDISIQNGSNPPTRVVSDWYSIFCQDSFLYVGLGGNGIGAFNILRNRDNYFLVSSRHQLTTIHPHIFFASFYPDIEGVPHIEVLGLVNLFEEFGLFIDFGVNIFTIHEIIFSQNLEVTVIDPYDLTDSDNFTKYPYSSNKSGSVTKFIPVAAAQIMTPLAALIYGLEPYKMIAPILGVQNIPEVLPEKAKYSDIFPPTENKIIYL
jgi:hypothetical protein